MTTENQSTEENSEWVAEQDIPQVVNTVPTRGFGDTPWQGLRWCPTHMRDEECQPGERLRCGPAWAELYEMEREAEAEKMGSNRAIVKLTESIADLIAEMQYVEKVVAPPRPPPPPPPPPPSPRPTDLRFHNGRSGKGGVELP